MCVSKRQFVITICISFFLSLSLLSGSLGAAEPDKSDTRILIDISGSMKKNDPKNLRRSALRLIVGLMPNDNRAGVWTFAQYTNMLVSLGVINDSWKTRAKGISEKIKSPGQFTNIEDVLRRSTKDWKDSDDKYRKNIILLTDGMVDISRDQKANAASRKRVIDELIPKIKSVGGKIHTIALSERADHDLLKTLSKETNGWYEQVNSADELQRVFLRMFEKVGKPDSVPLVGNKFQLDSSINEATLLVFTKKGDAPTKIMTPAGVVFDAQKSIKNVIWHRDEGYDLITIVKPEKGEWTIEADMDPDNRVMVVTNLKMKTTEIPHRMALGESIPVTVHFEEQGEVIVKKQFLDVVNVQASQFIRGVEGESRPLRDDGNEPDSTQGDGKFSITLGDGLDEGKVELVINADGKSFVRERRQATQIVEPAELKVEDDAMRTEANFSVHLDSEVVKTGTTSIEAWMENLDGERTPFSFKKSSDNVFKADVDKKQLLGRHFAVVNVLGKTLSGNDFTFQPKTIDVEGLAEPPAPEPEVIAEPAAPAPEPASMPEPVVEVPVEVVEEETDWTTIGIVIGVGNVILILLGVGIWWFMRKRAANDDDMMFEDDDDEAVAEKASDSNGDDEFDLEDSSDDSSGADETIDISVEDKK